MLPTPKATTNRSPDAAPDAPPWRSFLRILAAGLVAYGCFTFLVGADHAWHDGDVDMASRLDEYGSFRRGVYPNHALEKDPRGTRIFSIYPPYAFPLFVPFFEPEGRVQGRLMVESLSVAALLVIGLYGWRRFRTGSDGAAAAVAATLAAGIAANGNAIALGQWSILSMGLIAQTLILLDTTRPIAAGVCWALAMIKPQIALCFAPLFVFRGNLPGLIAGFGVLGLLTLLTCEWTGVSFRDVAELWLVRSRLEVNGDAGIPRAIAAWTGLTQRQIVGLAIGLLGVATVGLRRRLSRPGKVDLLPVAAVFSVIGALAFYHRHYDYVMLWPALLAAAAIAERRRDLPALAIAAAMLLSLAIPERWLVGVPYQLLVRSLLWSATGLWILGDALRAVGPAAGDGPGQSSSSSPSGDTAHSG